MFQESLDSFCPSDCVNNPNNEIPELPDVENLEDLESVDNSESPKNMDIDTVKEPVDDSDKDSVKELNSDIDGKLSNLSLLGNRKLKRSLFSISIE